MNSERFCNFFLQLLLEQTKFAFAKFQHKKEEQNVNMVVAFKSLLECYQWTDMKFFKM